MSYQAQDQLTFDATFGGRSRACCVQQAEAYRASGSPAEVATAEAVLKDDGHIVNAFTRFAAAGPGIADKADNGDGTIDQAAVTDADLLSLTQANWPTVAGLFFDDTGAAKP